MPERIPCPNCAEQILPTAKVCRFCQTKLTPQYVKDPKANKQIVAIDTLRTKGHSSEEIAAFLKSKGQRYLADNSDWTAEKVDQMIKQFIETDDVPQTQSQPQQKAPKKKKGLTKCKDCGQEISKKAKTCPHCGAKAPKKTSLFTWLVLFVGLYILYVAGTNHTPKSSSTTVQKSQSNNSTETVQTQKQAAPKSLWSHATSKDEMTGKIQAHAHSSRTLPTKKMNFPYNNVYAYLGIGCDGESEWVYIGFNDAPNLNNDDTKDGYNLIQTRIKWDDRVASVKLTQDWGSKFIHFRDYKSAISNIVKSNKMLLELDWHGSDQVYFPINLKGSSAELKKIRAICSK